MIAYLLLTGRAMQRTTYDVWGASAIGPADIVACTVPLLRLGCSDADPDLLALLDIA